MERPGAVAMRRVLLLYPPLKDDFDENGTYGRKILRGASAMAFEFDGEKYRQASFHQKEWGARLISEFQWRGEESVLDLGCGDGVLSAQLARLVPQGSVLGVDASQNMIAAARQQERENLHFAIQNIETMNFAEEFDVIFSNAELHWVKDHERLLFCVYKALKIDGIFRCNFAGKGIAATFSTSCAK